MQEWSQQAIGDVPQYEVVSVSGPAHARQFAVDVLLGGKLSGSGQAPSKKKASQLAAKAALMVIGSDVVGEFVYG